MGHATGGRLGLSSGGRTPEKVRPPCFLGGGHGVVARQGAGAEKDACRAFPEPQGDGLASGPKRNFQILAPLDFLAEFTQDIPPKGAHLIRYYGWYSNKARGMRRKAAEQAAAADGNVPSPVSIPARCSQTWAMLIKRVYECRLQQAESAAFCTIVPLRG